MSHDFESFDFSIVLREEWFAQPPVDLHFNSVAILLIGERDAFNLPLEIY